MSEAPATDASKDLAQRIVYWLALRSEPGTSGRRLAFAKWVSSPENPLAARVIVNRLWQFHFGTGLVDTPKYCQHIVVFREPFSGRHVKQ